MQKILLTAVILFALVSSRAQGPNILILSPAIVNADPSLKSDIELSGRRIHDEAEERLELERPYSKQMRSEPENIQLMEKKSNAFSKRIDFSNSLSYALSEYLQFRMLERFPGLVVYPDRQTCQGDTSELIAIAEKEKMQFIINPVQIDLIVADDKRTSKIRLQLYNADTHKLLLDKVFQGSDKNPGGDWNCDTGSVDCMINSAMATSIKDIFDAMFPRKPKVAAQK